MATWDKGTHITKVRWREICARTLREQQAVRQEAERTVPAANLTLRLPHPILDHCNRVPRGCSYVSCHS